MQTVNLNLSFSQNHILSNIRAIIIFIDFFNLSLLLVSSLRRRGKLPVWGGIVYFMGD